jgi:hypothetical protein
MQGHVVILALLSAINPTMLTAVAIMLSRERARASLTAYIVGGMVVSVGFGIATLTILKGVSVGKGHEVHISTAVEWVVGGLCLVAAALAPRAMPRIESRREAHAAKVKAKRGDEPSRMEKMLQKASLPVAFLVGVAFNLPGACYIVSIAEIADNRPDAAVWLPLILIFNVIMFLPAEVPLAVYVRDPDGTRRRVKGVQTWLRLHALTLARVMFAVVGVYLLARAVLGV